MEDKKRLYQMQETLLLLLPYWNCQITRPFKHLLDEGVSLEMYYCIQTLRSQNGILTMSELARWMQMPKHQMTKMANRMVENGFASRVYDPADRRVIRLQITEKAEEYAAHFLKENAGCFQELLERIPRDQWEEFDAALQSLFHILYDLSSPQ